MTMTQRTPDLLEAARLPALCRGVCLYAGLPLPPVTPSEERFVVRSGTEPPELLARLLEEGFVEDDIEVSPAPADNSPTATGTGPARVAVRPGFPMSCPDADELREAVAPAGESVLLFAVERLGAAGQLLGVTWAAVPEEEPPPQGRFRAAVRSREYDSPPGGSQDTSSTSALAAPRPCSTC
jgi:hypothetical protein